LKGLNGDGKSVLELVALYNKANREVAVLCNHKRTVGANHEVTMAKMSDQVGGGVSSPRFHS
jgi:DNA topoisomerase I